MANDITQWLEGLGLGQYAQAFAENNFGFDILPRLSDANKRCPGLIEVIRASEGQRLFASDNPAIGALLEASPARVCISRIARIEVYQQIAEPGETTPDGPHTHLLPELIMKGLAYDPAILIPGDMVPCLIAHPENRAANLE